MELLHNLVSENYNTKVFHFTEPYIFTYFQNALLSLYIRQLNSSGKAILRVSKLHIGWSLASDTLKYPYRKLPKSSEVVV